MSRIGKLPVVIPSNIQVKIENNIFQVSGLLGSLFVNIPVAIKYNFEGNEIIFERDNDNKKTRAMHGLIRTLCNNAVIGVSVGFNKTLQVDGVGYKMEMKGKNLQLNMGYSHPILFIPPAGITFELPSANTIKISGFDKQVVGLVASKIRGIRPPEPYKGKGIRYVGEYIRRKAGKTASK